MAVTLLVLLMTTGLLARFGLEDFVHALTFPGRITGAVLIAVSFTTFLGAAAVWTTGSGTASPTPAWWH